MKSNKDKTRQDKTRQDKTRQDKVDYLLPSCQGNETRKAYKCCYNDNGKRLQRFSELSQQRSNRYKKIIIIGGEQKHQAIKKDGICTCLCSAMGTGGGYIPMIVWIINQ